MPRGLVAMARSGGHCPLRVSGGILCSERGQSRDAFQAIPLKETSPRCNNTGDTTFQGCVGSSKTKLKRAVTISICYDNGRFLPGVPSSISLAQ